MKVFFTKTGRARICSVFLGVNQKCNGSIPCLFLRY